jgi:hypothetical protein
VRVIAVSRGGFEVEIYGIGVGSLGVNLDRFCGTWGGHMPTLLPPPVAGRATLLIAGGALARLTGLTGNIP